MRQPWHYWLIGVLLLGGLLMGSWWLLLHEQQWKALWQAVNDQQQLQAFVDQLGWFGPLALILLNALQIIVAPIPGYIIQAAAGFLYGPFWGGLWAALGQLLGSLAAMKLARLYGRPLVQSLIGAARLTKWEKVTHSESPLLWTVLLLGPTGDAPYHLAGLSRVSFVTILVISLCIRIPSVFVAAAVGAGAVTLPWWQFALLILALSAVIVVFLRYQTPLTAWFDQQVQQRLYREKFSDEQMQP
ncbi:MAG: TVP38/TMEM64 family protein [Caldilineaceae bacterium]|nr:TVP38/TMEM64 family protein [Caldilineaceae bacterium]